MPTLYMPNMDALPPPAIRDKSPIVYISYEELEALSEKYGFSPAQRKAVFLVAHECLTISEAARQANVSRRTIRTHLARVVKKISGE